jgi:hypothetical protein
MYAEIPTQKDDQLDVWKDFVQAFMRSKEGIMLHEVGPLNDK